MNNAQLPPRVGYRRDFNIFLNRYVYRRVPRPVINENTGLFPYWEPVGERWILYPELPLARVHRARNSVVYRGLQNFFASQNRDLQDEFIMQADQIAAGRGFDPDRYADLLRRTGRIPPMERAPPISYNPVQRWREIEEERQLQRATSEEWARLMNRLAE